MPPNGVLIFEAPDLERVSISEAFSRTGYHDDDELYLCVDVFIFRTHESSSFVSSHLKLIKNRLLLKIRFNALTSKLLYSCCTLCFSVQGGRILARAASADSAILDKVWNESLIYPREMKTGSKERAGGGEGKSLAYEHGSMRGVRSCVIINRIVSRCTGNVLRMIMKKHLFHV